MSDCQNSLLRSRPYLSGPQIFPVVLDFVNSIGGSIWDIYTQLPQPCNTFFIMSVKSGDEANSLWMSFIPTRKPRGTAFTSMNGTEQIFPLNGSQLILASPHYYTVLRFKEAVNVVYFHIGTENGGASRYTVACLNDGEVQLYGGLYT